ncbi:hypothetical protein NC653_034822 [Populus alba x Populus x berolinensis]|uniref:Uncharacterized protein n=1 Tax=Populus alba x Populus x berolinensis TaxID=444605 RepID=A0AAD6LND2_9ROSI|nr:hypothetical protein NC653_034822 [Populus alba x Populus x berolinensis]
MISIIFALCCFGLVLFKNNLFIKSTMFFYVSIFSLVAIGHVAKDDHAMHALDIVLQLFLKLTSFNNIRLDSC